MCKPRVGAEVRYTDLGQGVYYQMNGCWPANGGVFGKVKGHPSGNIVAVETAKGEIDQFIWRFSDGLNTHFTWKGKADA